MAERGVWPHRGEEQTAHHHIWKRHQPLHQSHDCGNVSNKYRTELTCFRWMSSTADSRADESHQKNEPAVRTNCNNRIRTDQKTTTLYPVRFCLVNKDLVEWDQKGFCTPTELFMQGRVESCWDVWGHGATSTNRNDIKRCNQSQDKGLVIWSVNKGHRQSPLSFAGLKSTERFNHMHTHTKEFKMIPIHKEMLSRELSGT